jgi:hypothetical protein
MSQLIMDKYLITVSCFVLGRKKKTLIYSECISYGTVL